jgi:hypothetical protein
MASGILSLISGQIQHLGNLLLEVSGLTAARTATMPDMSGVISLQGKGTDIASATTTDIGAATGDFLDITGTTTITGLGTIDAGIERTVRFTGILTLTHNATSLILPGGANITTAANDRAIFRSLGSGNWLCVTYQKASGAAVVSSGGGLTNWSESAGTYSSKDWKRFFPVSGTNVNVVFSPLGTGSIQAQVADGTSAGGNQRGSNAVDWQTKRSSASNVASGQESFVGGGYNNRAASQRATVGGGNANIAGSTCDAVCGGRGNDASGTYGFIGGGILNTASTCAAVGGGERNTATGTYSWIPGGLRGTTRGIRGMGAFASGRFSATGDAQCGWYVLRSLTTGATATVLTANAEVAGTDNQVILPNNSQYTFKALISSHRTDTVSGWTHRASWTVEGAVARDANAASTIVTAVINTITNTPGWTLTVTADTTNGGIAFTFTGEASKTIRTVAIVETGEVTS